MVTGLIEAHFGIMPPWHRDNMLLSAEKIYSMKHVKKNK